MATSTCSKCDGYAFEAVTVKADHYKFDLVAIQCILCGTVIGVLDSWNIGYLIHKLAEKLGVKL
jgi:hypothetical protein